MTAPWHIPNETSQQVVLAGFEDGSGAPATPNQRLLGDLTTTKTHELSTRQEVTGSYVRRAKPRKQLPNFGGTYAQDLTFESWPYLQRAAIKAGAAGVLVPGTTGAYEYKKAPSQNRDDIETLTIQHNVEGLGFEAHGVRFPENTITVDVDDADGVWKWSSPIMMQDETDLPGAFEGVATAADADSLTMTAAGWTIDEYAGAWIVLDYLSGAGEVRQILSNTVDTVSIDGEWDEVPLAGTTFRIEGLFQAGLPVPDEESIPSYDTRVFIDPLTGVIGTTEVLDRIISLNVTTQLNLQTKRFLSNGVGFSRRMGRGELLVTFQIRFEFDRRDEWLKWERLDGFKLRIEQEGSILDDSPLTRKLARIDILKAYWNQPTKDARNSNLTVTMAGVAYKATPYVEFTTRNGLASLAA